MRTYRALTAVLLLAAASVGGDKPKRNLRYAPTWDDAVTEGRVLNLPIVVHRHGFY